MHYNTNQSNLLTLIIVHNILTFCGVLLQSKSFVHFNLCTILRNLKFGKGFVFSFFIDMVFNDALLLLERKDWLRFNLGSLHRTRSQVFLIILSVMCDQRNTPSCAKFIHAVFRTWLNQNIVWIMNMTHRLMPSWWMKMAAIITSTASYLLWRSPCSEASARSDMSSWLMLARTWSSSSLAWCMAWTGFVWKHRV